MLRKLIPVLATLALAGAITTSASAQDSSAMRAGMARQSYQVFVTAVNATPATITALKARPAITANQVTLVSLRDLSDGQPDSVVTVLLQPHQADILQLQGILNEQAEVTGLLKTQTPALTTADVVAVGTNADGRLVLFYRPRM